jgi:hypothetical protein
MSRMTAVRSMAVRPRIFSRLRCWAGRELVVEDDGVGIDGLRQLVELLGLAPAHIGGRIGMVPTLDDAADHVGAGRPHQQGQLVEVGVDHFGSSSTGTPPRRARCARGKCVRSASRVGHHSE